MVVSFCSNFTWLIWRCPAVLACAGSPGFVKTVAALPVCSDISLLDLVDLSNEWSVGALKQLSPCHSSSWLWWCWWRWNPSCLTTLLLGTRTTITTITTSWDRSSRCLCIPFFLCRFLLKWGSIDIYAFLTSSVGTNNPRWNRCVDSISLILMFDCPYPANVTNPPDCTNQIFPV